MFSWEEGDNKKNLIWIIFKLFHQIHFFNKDNIILNNCRAYNEKTTRSEIVFKLKLVYLFQIILLFDTLRNCKRRNKGQLKSNSNKIMLCGGGGQHILGLNKISTLWFHFLGLFTVFKWIKQYFPRKRLSLWQEKVFISLSLIGQYAKRGKINGTIERKEEKEVSLNFERIMYCLVGFSFS